MSNKNTSIMRHSDMDLLNQMISWYLRNNLDSEDWAWEIKHCNNGQEAYLIFEYRAACDWDNVNNCHVFDLCGVMAGMHRHKYVDADVVEHYSIGYNAEGRYGCSFLIEWT